MKRDRKVEVWTGRRRRKDGEKTGRGARDAERGRIEGWS